MNVQCSWKVSDGRPISDAIFYSRESDDADLEDEINVENCVFLKAPDQSEGLYPTVPACQLLICCEPPNQIIRLSAICEAKVIEIYGHHGEYLKTVFNTPLEEGENLFVYRGDITLDKPLSVCSVKFVNLESQNEMWLFGVKIHTDKSEYKPMSPSPFAAIQEKLESMKDSVEDKDALKRLSDNLFKMGLSTAFQQMPTAAQWKSMNENMPANWHNLLQEMPTNLVQKFTLKNSEEATFEKSKHLIDPNSNIQINNSDQVPKLTEVSTSPVLIPSQSSSTQTEEDYCSLEEKIKILVNDQMQTINKRFAELEAKILCKLDEIESYVKPQGVQVNQ